MMQSYDYPDLIYCATGNRQYAQIATQLGMRYGTRLPSRVYHENIFFADQDWKRPDKDKYMRALAQHEPYIATVLDYESPAQFDEVMTWAEEASRYVQIIVVIPKFSGAISHIPESVNNKTVRLGYSVPTRYGATSVPVWEFGRREVHLLDDRPAKQLMLKHYINVKSADINYFHHVVRRGEAIYGNRRLHVNSVYSVDKYKAIYLAFEISVINYMFAMIAQNNTIALRYATERDIPALKKLGMYHKTTIEKTLLVCTSPTREGGGRIVAAKHATEQIIIDANAQNAQIIEQTLHCIFNA